MNAPGKKTPRKLSTYDDILTFGKHKGKTVEQVLDEEPSYLKWAVLEDVISLPAHIEAEVMRRTDK